MTFGRDKRLLLGVLALLAPLPLPFNGVVGWPSVLLFWTVTALFLYRAWRDAAAWLPAWAMNVLALAYLPFFFGDLTVFWSGRVLQPLAHLAMFTLAVKLFALKREQDKWHAVLAIFFLYLAAMGSSVHPSVVVYQLAILALMILVLVRFAGFHEEGRVSRGAAGRGAVPVARFVAALALLVSVAAIPLFVVLPRLRQPYLTAPGVPGGSGEVTGFSEQVDLDSIGRVRLSSAVAFRFAFDGPSPPRQDFRFKAATYDLFLVNSWRRSARYSKPKRRGPDGFFHVAEGRPRQWTTIWMKRMASPRLVLPVETVALDPPTEILAVDETGVVTLLAQPAGALTYRAGLANEPARGWLSGGPGGPSASDLDVRGLSPRVEELASRVMGGEGETPAVRAARLESFLMREYDYSLDLQPPRGADPLEAFLFESRQGHCEYFATSMVLMLRSQGIPARLVTGYYGAEFNPLEEYFIVRQSNAHAWVEAYLPDAGWRVFDPTPAAGLPVAQSESWTRIMVQAYDYLLFRWDRYVLTYGFSDQAGVFFRLRSLWADLWERLRGGGDKTGHPTAGPELPAADSGAPESTPAPTLSRFRWLPLLVVALAVLAWLWRRRNGLDATAAYRLLRSDLARGRSELPASAPPLEVERRLIRRCPQNADRAGRIVRRYLTESFAGEPLDEAEREELRQALRQVRRELRKTA